MKSANGLVLAACLALVGVGIAADEKASDKPAPTSSEAAPSSVFKQPKTFAELLALKPEDLEKVDIALIDLLCAEGLRGAEDLDLQQCLKTLDVLAEHVKAETERNRHYFVENPKRFKNSEGYFRMTTLPPSCNRILESNTARNARARL